FNLKILRLAPFEMTTTLMIQSVVPTPPRPPSLESHPSFHHLSASKMVTSGGGMASPVGSVAVAGQVVVDSATAASSPSNRIHLVSRQWADDSQAVSAARQHLAPLNIMHTSSHHRPNSLSSSPTSSSSTSPPMSSSPSSSSSPNHLPHLLRSTSSPPYQRTHSHHHQLKLSSSSDSTSISSAYSEESTTMTDEDDIV